MGKLKDAYDKWAKSKAIGSGGVCCAAGHYIYNYGSFDHKPDESVCERERAWREYVRLRDQNPNWPFVTSRH